MKWVFILLAIIFIVWIISRSRREGDKSISDGSSTGSSSDSMLSGSNCNNDNNSCDGGDGGGGD
jgi:hypothetical protein